MIAIKQMIKNNKLLLRFFSSFYNFFSFNKIRAKRSNCFKHKYSFFYKSAIIVHGKNNVIEIGKMCIARKSKIYIYGNNNIIKIGNDCRFYNSEIYIEDNCNCVEIKNNSSFCGCSQLAAIEGTKILIGSNCLFSNNFQIRTGDSHSIFDENMNRINYSQDVVIGDHVWVGANTTILKGVSIANNVVVGTHSLVTKSILQNNSIFAGNPAKLIKSNIRWEAIREE